MITKQDLQFNEYKDSKLPAMIMLKNMGYEYLTPDEVNELRYNKQREVILEKVLEDWLRKNNKIEYGQSERDFSESSIRNAINKLKYYTNKGLIQTNKDMYETLLTGESHPENVEGTIRSFNIKYIDWENPENNVYHFTEEYTVERVGIKERIRPDIVIFINGIPLCVIECKSSAIKDPIKEGISQMIRNQTDEYAPHLFYYAQILIVLAMNEAQYGTVGTKTKFWTAWNWNRESQKYKDSFNEIYNIMPNMEFKKKLINTFKKSNQNKMKKLLDNLESCIPKEQDHSLYSLCQPKRILQLIRKYILFDRNEKKIARYQQYFCVEKIMHRIFRTQEMGRRMGGVVWHTQGSGKSLTMVMLARSIALNKYINNYRIVLVTDRINLDKQLHDTFHDCGKEPIKARSGSHLAELLKHKNSTIITTVIDKFENAAGKMKEPLHNPNVFVLVDEGHRTQYGEMHAIMKKAMPTACYIAFTGTPVMNKDKNTIKKFGGLIDSYTIEQAVADKNVVPLLYEGRLVPQDVNKEAVDNWFEKQTRSLNSKQKSDLKRKFASSDKLNEAEQKIKMIAFDISQHFAYNWRGKGFKAQIITQSKAAALKFKYYLDKFEMVTSEVIMSGPDQREGYSDPNDKPSEMIQFWNKMMKKYGSEKQYNDMIISSFKEDEEPEIIIVIDKLITGFDAPVNTILYLARKLKDHTLLQAIARVNRLKEGKEYGYIIDYYGILENLDNAMEFYRALPEFDKDDLKSVFIFIDKIISELRKDFDKLNDLFKEVKNKNDIEECEKHLADEELRDKFYMNLLAFSKSLSIALSNNEFHEKTKNDKIQEYKNTLKFFSKLRVSVRRRYSDAIDYAEYEPQIKKLIDEYVGAGEIEQITPLVNIFNEFAFNEEVSNLRDDGSKADAIATRTQKTIQERYEEDPAFYKKFSEILENVIKAYREQRLNDAEYLKKAMEIKNTVINRTD
ncbi:type I restriction endonuclease subunit R, partial [candidate division WOR-3 bacterium]|nr:type I restriction endonuclease subunit R [candidate division WOR-3 bacterium]